jgi:hypothetical protein
VTDKQRVALLDSAIRELKETTKGYSAAGPHWKEAMERLERLRRDLSPLPDLGPVWAGGKSVLEHDLTHKTSGINLYPAFDDAFNQGRVVIAPEPLVVVLPATGSVPGKAFYARGRSRLHYWFGHLDRSHPPGTSFAKGAAVGRVAANSIGGGPHVHVGINIEELAGDGRQLLHHSDYTHGAPTVGAQLKKLT